MKRTLLPSVLILLWTFAAHAMAAPRPPEVAADAHLLVDFHSGQVLAEHGADARVEPASLTKMMTAYVVFREMAAGHVALDDQVRVSEKAWRKGGSKMWIEVDKQVSLADLLRGMIVQSGNDASIALAEHVAGSEESFADLMNQTAARLGLEDTHFVNSTGWPDPEHYTTARDMVTLARALIRDFPEHYAWHAEKSFTFNGITQHNRNRLLWQDDSVDGIKTGHTEAAGFCLVASAARDGMRLISAVMGAADDGGRTGESRKLLNWGFRFFETHRLYQGGQALSQVRVWKGAAKAVGVGLERDLYVTVPRGRYQDLEAVVELDGDVVAPVVAGQRVGWARVSLGGEVISESPLVAHHGVGEGSLWSRMLDHARLWFQ